MPVFTSAKNKLPHTTGQATSVEAKEWSMLQIRTECRGNIARMEKLERGVRQKQVSESDWEGWVERFLGYGDHLPASATLPATFAHHFLCPLPI